MRGIVRGTVVEIEDSSYTNAQGQRVQQHNVYIKQDGGSERYGADRLNCRPEHLPNLGDRVEMLVNFAGKISKAGKEYLSVFVVAEPHVLEPAKSLKAVNS